MSKRPLTNGSGEKRLPSKIDAGYVIKTIVCVLLFLAAVAFFAYVCRQLSDNYMLLLMPTTYATVTWLINFGVAILVFAIMAGVVAILVRPYWIVIVAFLLSALLYPLIVGMNLATWIVAGVFAILMCIYLLYIARQLKNQINFSAHPLSDMKLLLLSLLVAQVCVAFGLGYIQDSARRNYVLPPEIKAPIASGLLSQATANINQAKATDAQKKVAVEAANKQVKTTVDDLEKQFQAIKYMIPYVLGVLLFFLLQTILLVLGFLPIAIARLLFMLLKVTRFANVTVETREIKHLTLKPVPLASSGKSK
ncbi:MAG: hypothetical protein PHC53_01460 [Patescibacteria group bacterium]|nr:hypothetical protein [Patescibacteria group bacterium]